MQVSSQAGDSLNPEDGQCVDHDNSTEIADRLADSCILNQPLLRPFIIAYLLTNTSQLICHPFPYSAGLHVDFLTAILEAKVGLKIGSQHNLLFQEDEKKPGASKYNADEPHKTQ